MGRRKILTSQMQAIPKEYEQRLNELRPLAADMRERLRSIDADLQVFSQVVCQNGIYRQRVTVRGSARVFNPLMGMIKEQKKQLEMKYGLGNIQIYFKERPVDRLQWNSRFYKI